MNEKKKENDTLKQKTDKHRTRHRRQNPQLCSDANNRSCWDTTKNLGGENRSMSRTHTTIEKKSEAEWK